jgi:hypothetical protein
MDGTRKASLSLTGKPQRISFTHADVSQGDLTRDGICLGLSLQAISLLGLSEARFRSQLA